MHQVALRTALDARWRSVPSVSVGATRSDVSPDIYAAVDLDGVPTLRIDVHEPAPFHDAFRAAIVWESFVIIGFGAHVHLVALGSHAVESLGLDGYFGHFHVHAGALLVSDAQRLRAIDAAARVLWESAPVGVDGVLVDRIDGDVILGRGEWDPPGGWRPFRLSLTTGQPR